ncbi:amidohydrolase family protein [Lysobacter enzymogenes]|nr:amidohydrolase family protein [Lysobacter enzymogenes]
MDDVLSDEDIVAGVTIVPATMVGWDPYLGSIEAGKWADLLVLEGAGDEPYARLLEAKETAIRAVVIDGRVRLAEVDGLVTYSPLSAEQISIGGKPYVIDLAEAGPSGAGGMTLADAIEHIRFGLSKLPEFEKAGKKELFLAG